MSHSNEHLEVIRKLQASLDKVVDLGFGDDECGCAVSVMFEDVVKQLIPGKSERKQVLASPDNEHSQDRRTCAQLLAQANAAMEILDCKAERKTERAPVVFPFITTLGISGGILLLSFHVTRLGQSLL